MARIAGYDLPKNKQIHVALQYIYGIGKFLSKKILEVTQINPGKKVADLTPDEVTKLREQIEKKYKVEGDLRTETAMNIKRLKDIGCYRGIRHIKKLPVRGQRTSTNARTHKGARPPVGGKKKAQEATRAAS
ncbi:MAG: 30S ribosomal protein S13 [Spirochaetes bacterium]|nr:30S ribosomal protein S13 [Spirochaetota bacterium]